MSNEKEIAREQSRANARRFGAVVYVGGTVAATVLFLTFILTAFPEDAYFSRVVMTLAALAVGSSMLAFPVALHNWVVTSNHRSWGIALYYGEMALIAVNTVVSFVSLLAEYTGYAAPEWTVLYEPFSVASIIYTVFAWGTIFLLDPQHKAYAADQENETKLLQKVEAMKRDFLDTEDGQQLIRDMSRAEIAAGWTVEGHLKHKGLQRDLGIPVSGTPFQKKEASSPSPLPKTDEPEK